MIVMPAPTSIKAVGFDLDDTLLDHSGAARTGLQRAVAQWGGTYSAEVHDSWDSIASRHFERWRSGLIDFDEQRRERLRDFLPLIGVALPQSADGVDEVFSTYRHAYRAAWAVFPVVIDLLSSLRAAGYATGLLTNGDEEQQLDKLDSTGLEPHLDAVCISGAIGVQKPDPRAFGLLAQKLRVDASQVLFVGDSTKHDVNDAVAAGMKALLVDRTAGHADGIAASVAGALSRA